MTRAFAPTCIEDAAAILADPDLGAVAIAGATDLMVMDHARDRVHKAVVDLSRLPELKGIRVEEGFLSIGAAETFWALRHDALVRAHAPALAGVAATVGAWQIQARATLGGNIANASPAGDSLPVLLALRAVVDLTGPAGTRAVPYDCMHLGYRQTALAPGELIRRVRIPLPPPGARQAFRKVGTREAQAISKVLVALYASFDGDRLVDVALGAGSVAATPVRLRRAEAALNGYVPDEARARAAAEAAQAEVTPIDDVRSTAEYRGFALAQVVWRLVMDLTEGSPT